MFDPPVDGEKWRIGAVSTAEWTGVPLAAVLDRAGVAAPAREVLFQGADSGIVSGRSNVTRFERSLRLDRAREAGALLAYAMNGESLPTQHGHPLRLVVPGWYAVASVKWLTSIQLVADSFDGYFQSEKYWYEPEQEGSVREPVTLQRVRALITDPAPDQQVSRGQVTVRGVAWSGTAPIASVQVSVDDGTWEEARILGESRPHRWQWWELMTSINRSGRAILRARATDQAGQTQPIRATRNRLGYGNNSIQEMPIWVM
jgi:DMSO/TMAO reductase YedYZ molybdopterin-dependent catalytic subunit